jgi:hypothetical protein
MALVLAAGAMAFDWERMISVWALAKPRMLATA